MTANMFMALLLGLAIQFVVIYGAIRMALRDDRASKTRAAAAAAAKVKWKAQAEAAKAANVS